MTTYTKIDAKMMEVAELIEDKARYDIDVVKSKIAYMQGEIARLQVIVDEALKIGII